MTTPMVETDKAERLKQLLGHDQIQSSGAQDLNKLNVEITSTTAHSRGSRGKGRGRGSKQPATPLPQHDPSQSVTSDMDSLSLQLGQLALETELFVPLKALGRFPAWFVPATQQAQVTVEFFMNGKIYERTWDVYYIYPPVQTLSQKPLFLIPYSQFEQFLDDIKRKLHIRITLPQAAKTAGFLVSFDADEPRPRYLGRSNSAEMMEQLKASAPISSFKPDNEPADAMPDRSLEAFREKMERIAQLDKQKKLVARERKKAERVDKQKNWGRVNKRVQRYLGLRAVGPDGWEERQPVTLSLDVNKPAPYPQDGAVVFVSIDVEAWEMNQKAITEIGISTLDTKDIASMAPGKGGENWMKAIKARHFRIQERAHLINSRHVPGCPDKFQFGESEFVPLKDAAQVIASCFKFPQESHDGPERNFIIVGHGVVGDINWIKSLGFDPTTLSNHHETVDTDIMFRAYRREIGPRSLGAVLSDLDIAGWYLHNGGNDAAYTLQAMLGIAVRDLDDRVSNKSRAAEIERRINKAMQEAAENVRDMQEGWSSDGEHSDGGFHIITSSKLQLRDFPSPMLRQPGSYLADYEESTGEDAIVFSPSLRTTSFPKPSANVRPREAQHQQRPQRQQRQNRSSAGDAPTSQFRPNSNTSSQNSAPRHPSARGGRGRGGRARGGRGGWQPTNQSHEQ